jgi:formamidopyrimidine-DNA glycosylase
VPELPEVRAQAGRLDQRLGGRVLERFTPLSFTALKTAVPSPSDAVGTAVSTVGSRGKYLLVELAPLTFVVHLMQGGRLEPDEKQSAKPKGGLARWHFDDGSALLLSEFGREHRAGVWVVDGQTEGRPPLEGLGPDADGVTAEQLGSLVAATSVRLHTFLRDQRHIAGIGRRLANEVCHRARLSPFASTKKLTDDEVGRLHEAIGEAIAESLAYEATQDHMTKSAQRPSRVHHHAGDPCPVCGDVVRAVEYNAYTVNYCATCQTAGKVLADNTTSKFLK